jgi:hypothetical protein
MSSPTSPQKGFGGLLCRIFGSKPEQPPANIAPETPRRLPKAPAPIVPPAPQVLIPRKGVGTVLRKAVQPGGAPHREPDALWASQPEAEAAPRPAKAPSRLLNLPRTVLSMWKKAPPPRKQLELNLEETAAVPAPDFTRRKERDYPII